MSEWKEIPLLAPPYESAEEEQLDQWAATAVDLIPMMIEKRLQMIKRPGLLELFDLNTNLGIDGLYWFDKQNVALVVSAGRVWKITDPTGSRTELTGSTDLRISSPVSFAKDATKVVMANGGKMVHTNLSTLTTMADVDAPTAVTHVADLDGYIIANEAGTGKARFSAINDMTGWTNLDFFSAESDPDDLLAMKVAFREIIAIGNESVEFWANDGVSPFSRIQGSAQPYGISAPYSLAQVGNSWMWLSDRRKLVTMEGRQVVEVSTPYDRVIHSYPSVSDAVGYTVAIDGLPIYVLNFQSARQTLAFNYVTKEWHKWGYWDSQRGHYQRYRGLSYCYAKAWNLHLVGDYATGKVYVSRRGIYNDAGNPIRSLLRTGHLSHGASFSKRSEIVRLRCKRGQGQPNQIVPNIMMRRRVNGSGEWGQERWRNLGAIGEHDLHVEWRNNGVYKTCQYEFSHSDNSDLVLIDGQERLTILGR
jgi:hypothetical protein